MNNNFKFISEDNLYLSNNGKQVFQFSGESNTPYFYLPFQLWFFEKQMSGTDCFRDYKGLHHQEINDEYRDKFYMLNRMYIPKNKMLPVVRDDDFNEIIKNIGLINIHNMTLNHKLILEQNEAVIKRPKHGATTHLKEFEVLRYNAEDITSLNEAYRNCMLNVENPVIKNIYEEIAHQIYIASFQKS
jgi:hypothetical protein